MGARKDTFRRSRLPAWRGPPPGCWVSWPPRWAWQRLRDDVLRGGVRDQGICGVQPDHGGRGAVDARRAAHLRLDAGPAGAESRGSPGLAPARRRRPEELSEGRNITRPGRSDALYAGAADLVRAGVAHVRGDSVRRAAADPLGSRADGR